MNAADKTFLGIGWSFPPQFQSGDFSVSLSEGEENINESISIILYTNKRSRLFLSNFGVGINRYVFAGVTTSMKSEMESSIRGALETDEPRINVESIEIDDSRSADGFIDITIGYTVIQTNHRRNYVIPFAILEGTSLEKTHA